VQDVVAKFAQSFLDFPLLQKPASFNMVAIKAQVATMAASHDGP
jgi:hypothetical protein